MSGALKTPLYNLHKQFGGKFVNYANYLLPISYESQTHIESHLFVRKETGVFDVSHMLQHRLVGNEASSFLETLVPTDIESIKPGNGHLSTFLNSNGGIIDDTIITKVSEDEVYFVSNGATSNKISKFINDSLNSYKNGNHGLKYENFKKSLIAIQGPKAFEHVGKLLKTDLKDVFFGNHFFLDNNEKVIGKGFIKNFDENSNGILVSRSGYTGEDGFELSIPNPDYANELVKKLLESPKTRLIGLAARDSLRLEAGMCLYGNELTEKITPVEANLNWVVSKNRRNLNASFNGVEKIVNQLNDKSLIPYKRTGFVFENGRAARTGDKIFKDSEEVGFVSSGSPSPSLSESLGKKVNVGQAYLKLPFNKNGTSIEIQIGKKLIKAKVKKLPLVETHYFKNV